MDLKLLLSEFNKTKDLLEPVRKQHDNVINLLAKDPKTYDLNDIENIGISFLSVSGVRQPLITNFNIYTTNARLKLVPSLVNESEDFFI